MRRIGKYIRDLFTFKNSYRHTREATYGLDMIRELSCHGYDCGPEILYFASPWSEEVSYRPVSNRNTPA